ncbi:hypothetical protein COOONC_12449 [Cooperia oncophora]
MAAALPLAAFKPPSRLRAQSFGYCFAKTDSLRGTQSCSPALLIDRLPSKCATTQTGELLNYYSMVNTHRAGVRIWPTMYVNGVFFDRSYPVDQKLCEQTAWC